MAATFDELVIIWWTDPQGRPPTVWTDEFNDFADKIQYSRYYQVRPKHKYNGIIIIDDLTMILDAVTDWAKFRIPFVRVDEYATPTVYFGFQGGPGWTHPEFHDILNKVTSIPAWFPGVAVSWLPDNWFDHGGLVPPDLTTPEHTLEWLNLQAGQEIEEIIYDYKGEHTDG